VLKDSKKNDELRIPLRTSEKYHKGSIQKIAGAKKHRQQVTTKTALINTEYRYYL